MKTLSAPYPWFSKLAQSLQNQIMMPPQALCFIGVPGLGQEELADSFARAILCVNDLSMHPDYLSIAPEPGKSIGIDRVREIHDFCLVPPTQARRKIIRVTAMETMTLPAQQAFLKTLEEPVIPSSFIIVCSQPNKLLPTVRSRCQLLTLPTVNFQEAAPWLKQQDLTITPEAYALSDGAPLWISRPEFQSRLEAYHGLKDFLSRPGDPLDAAKPLAKGEPLEVLTGFYYALMHLHQFNLLDTCIALRKQFADNANLNWEMQLNRFFMEVKARAC